MPIAAAVPAIIGAAGAVGGGLLGASQARGQTGVARGDLQGTLSSALQGGNNLMTIAQGGLGSAANFYNTLMSGNQQQIQQLLAPEISGVNQQYNQAFQSGAQLQPRSGMTAASNASLPFQKESTIGNAIMGMPLQGASGLLNTSNIAGNQGSNMFNVAQGAGSALGNIGLGIGTQGISGAQGGLQMGNNIAAGLAQAFPGIMGAA